MGLYPNQWVFVNRLLNPASGDIIKISKRYLNHRYVDGITTVAKLLISLKPVAKSRKS
jgi:hypothetical protein